MVGGKMGPEYSFPSFTVTVVRGSGFKPLLRPGSSCLGLGTGLHAQTWCWHPRILTALVGASLRRGRAVRVQSNRGHDFSLTTERPRGFSCSCSRALVLWFRGADSLQLAESTAGTVALCHQSCCPSRGAELHEPRAPPGGQVEEGFGALQVAPPQLWGHGVCPHWSPLLSSS